MKTREQILEDAIMRCERDIMAMEANNDGSLRWVDELRELYNLQDEYQMKLCALQYEN